MLVSIRRMRKSDLEEILSIEKKSYLTPWSRSAFENEIQADYAYPLVISRDNSSEIIGYLCCWLILDECHILNVSIHPLFQRQGLASQLIQYLFDFCKGKGVHHYYLEVRESNRGAISLYKKNGFRISGLRKHYYTDTGEDALLMQRRQACP